MRRADARDDSNFIDTRLADEAWLTILIRGNCFRGWMCWFDWFMGLGEICDTSEGGT